MRKKVLILLVCLGVFMTPITALAESKEIKLDSYRIANETMTIQLPNGWYINTPKEIDEEFLKVTENTERKLKKYLSESDVAYNILSPDLTQEINVIVQHNSRTKLIFDFNTLEETALTEQADVLIAQGTQESDTGSTTYETYTLEKINQCTFMVFEGSLKTDDNTADFIQYTTTVNGYGITISYRAYEGANMNDGQALLKEIMDSLTIDEILETDRQATAIKQMIPPIILVVGFVSVTVFMFIRQLKKNKKN